MGGSVGLGLAVIMSGTGLKYCKWLWGSTAGSLKGAGEGGGGQALASFQIRCRSVNKGNPQLPGGPGEQMCASLPLSQQLFMGGHSPAISTVLLQAFPSPQLQPQEVELLRISPPASPPAESVLCVSISWPN